MTRMNKTFQNLLFALITVTPFLLTFYYNYMVSETETRPAVYSSNESVVRLYSKVATIFKNAFELVSSRENIMATSTKSIVNYKQHENILVSSTQVSVNYSNHGDTMAIYTQSRVNYNNNGNIIEISTQSTGNYDNHGNIIATSTRSSTSYPGIKNIIHNGRDDFIIPGQNSWIPYPVKRNPSGPFIIKMNDGSVIKYTNYTFYPLSFTSKYVINNPDICKDVTDLTFLIMVHTAVRHFYQRQALRKTWANPRLLKKHSSRILFLVGRIEKKNVQRSLEKESKQFQDIVQGDFIDDYHNLTHKGVLGYRWITEHCQNAKFILKIDDDVFVNIFRVIHALLPKFKDGQRKIACHVNKHLIVFRRGKYAFDPDYFPLLHYVRLQYCSGPFVLMPRSIVPEMYEAARTTPFIWIDDFYLFGILPNKMRNFVFLPLDDVNNIEQIALTCYLGDKPCNYLAAYAWTPGVMYAYWNSTLNMHKELVKKYANEIR
ncbi:hypothetical protein ACJMK2_014332 [Sinanodonta woodiana]|uniref:Hexosyltransferase n=1 Tax=Sinanodonta woodiana TaxID=1069815 RepID=A0ABD3V3E5_SINWO